MRKLIFGLKPSPGCRTSDSLRELPRSSGNGRRPGCCGVGPAPPKSPPAPYKYGGCAQRVYQTAGTAMPGFEKVLSEEQRRSLADYVSGLGRP